MFRRWFRRCFVFRHWFRWCNVNRIAFGYFLECPRKCRLRPLWWLQKSSGVNSCRPPNCPVDASSLVFCSTGGIQADVYPTDTSQSDTMKLNKSPFRFCFGIVRVLDHSLWYADRLVAQLNGCASSTSQAYAPLR